MHFLGPTKSIINYLWKNIGKGVTETTFLGVSLLFFKPVVSFIYNIKNFLRSNILGDNT